MSREFRTRPAWRWCFLVVLMLSVVLAGDRVLAQTAEESASKDPAVETQDSPKLASPPAVPEGVTPLNPAATVFLDTKEKRLLVKGRVALREGMLEMFACPKQTKEHESILGVESLAQTIHAGLLALGAKSGTPVRFNPVFAAPTGPEVVIRVLWNDLEGKPHRATAQEWIRNATMRYFTQTLDALPKGLEIPEDSGLFWDDRHKELLWYGHMTDDQKTKMLALSKDPKYQAAIDRFYEESSYRQMDAKFVFAGSGFDVDPETGKKRYLAEGGDLICVANFSTATIDVARASSASGEELLYEAWTQRIPPIDTPVLVELSLKPDDPRKEKPAADVPSQ